MRWPAAIAVLLLTGCTTSAPPPQAQDPDPLAGHLICNFPGPLETNSTCDEPAIQAEAATALYEAWWICTVYISLDHGPDIFFWYDRQAERNAIWFNFTRENPLGGTGRWHGSFAVNASYYEITFEGPSGYALLPDTLPEGEFTWEFSPVAVSTQGALANAEHDIVWIREPSPDHDTAPFHHGVIHTLTVNATTYYFYSLDEMNLSTGNRHWQGSDYNLTIQWWPRNGIAGHVRPTGPYPIDVRTPYGDLDQCRT